jgi:hypothetical protein
MGAIWSVPPQDHGAALAQPTEEIQNDLARLLLKPGPSEESHHARAHPSRAYIGCQFSRMTVKKALALCEMLPKPHSTLIIVIFVLAFLALNNPLMAGGIKVSLELV